MRFLRQNLLTFIWAFTVTIAVTVASVFIFLSMRDHLLKSGLDSLANQAQICSGTILKEVEDFKEDAYFFIVNPDFDPFTATGELNPSARLRLRNFLAQNINLLDSIHVYTRDSSFVATLTEGMHLRYQYDSVASVPAYFEELEDVAFQFLPERNLLVYKDEGRVYTFTTNITRFVRTQFANYYLGENGYKFIYTGHMGVLPVDHPGDLNLEVVPLSEAYLAKLEEQSINRTAYQFEAEVLGPKSGHTTLIAFYPLSFFGDNYGILFGKRRSEIVRNLTGTFLVIAGINLALVILIVGLFTHNMNRVNRTSQELEDSREKMAELVRQQKLLFEYSEDFTYRYDLAGNYDYVSENIQKVLGYTPEQFERPENRIYTENPMNREASNISRQIMREGGESRLFYVEMIHQDGEPKTLEVREKPFQDVEGTVQGVIGIAKDVTEKFASDQKFRVLFEFSSDPHLLYDDTGIIDCNEAAVRILGYETKDNLIGKPPSYFSPERQPDGRLSHYKAEEMDNIANEKGQHRFEWQHVKRSGEVLPVEVSLTPVSINHRTVILTVWHDLTERKRVEHVLIDSKKKAEELANSKQQFLSSMSHEIRTPLNAVIGYTHLLLEENPKNEQVDKLRSLKFSADNLLSLVNDILDHSKIESGKIVFASEKFDLRDRMVGLREVMDIKAQKKGLSLELTLDERIPPSVLGDPVRLNQILLNLVSNAIKFTEKGRVHMAVRIVGETDTHWEVRFDVEDTGIGISPDKHKSIFDTFVQADSTILNNYGGTGLGLSITKNLVEMQGGKIDVDSTPGEGSTFSFTLNFRKTKETSTKPSDAKKADKKSSRSDDPSLRGARVLLVEDNPINQKIATQFLNKWGANVTVANNGREGLHKITDKKYDFVLMDLQMPEMDGYESTRAIRGIEDDYFKQIPIITLTADAFTEVRDRVLEAGMTDYVTKPINPDQFLKTISKYYKPKS